MGQSHSDADAEWFKKLVEKSQEMQQAGTSKIAGGRLGEDSLNEWKSHGVSVRQLPNDELGVLRISIGGGDTPIPLNYCVFRGDHSKCVDLLRSALKAMENPQ